MKIYKVMDKSKIALLWGLVLTILAVLLIFPKECRNGGTNGTYLCIQVLIPSLFPFMVLCTYITQSGIAACSPEWINKITTVLFRLPSCCACVILLSLVGGYPVGASGIKSLWQQKLITTKQAKRMGLFCVASGPGFLVTYIGAVMTESLKTGYILLASQTISVIALGIAVGFFADKNDLCNHRIKTKPKLNLTKAIIPSVTQAINNCALMCALVVLFSAIAELFISLSFDNRGIKWIVALLEITNGAKILTAGYPTVALSAACGFGGVCVHFQVLSQLKGIGISKTMFFLFRVMQSILSGVCTYILLKFFPVTRAVFSTVKSTQFRLDNTTAGCIVLVLCCCAFLLSLKVKTTSKQ